MQFHPMAGIFPLMEGKEFGDLVADIKKNGLLQPIVVYEDKILDGRNRFIACTEAKIAVPEDRFTPYIGDDPLGFVVSSNLHRRHLSVAQRSMIAVQVANMRRGRPPKNTPNGGISQGTVARTFKVGKNSVQRAATVYHKGIPELANAVMQDQIPVHLAASIAEMPEAIQMVAAQEPIRAKQIVRDSVRQKRQEEMAQITQRASEKAGAQLYSVIYADPPGIEGLGTLLPPAAPDCILFIWTSVPSLKNTMDLLRYWEFNYRNTGAWVRPANGTGHWFHNELELLLVATKGNSPPPMIHVPQVITSTSHLKPEAFIDNIAAMFPHIPKLDMFATAPRTGWDMWSEATLPGPEAIYEDGLDENGDFQF